MPPKAGISPELTMKVLLECLYVMEQAENKPDLRVVCANLGLSWETWRKKLPALMKAHQEERGSDGAPATAPATPNNKKASARSTPASKLKSTPAKSSPLKRELGASPSPGGKRQKKTPSKVKDENGSESGSVTEDGPDLVTIAVNRPKRATSAKKGKYAADSESEDLDDGDNFDEGKNGGHEDEDLDGETETEVQV